MTPRRRAASRVSRFARKEGGAHEGRAQAHTPSPLTIVAPSPARMRAGARQENTRGRGPDLPAAIAEQLVAGHLSQRCEPCGITEAAGGSCTSCGRLTGPADWFRGTSRKTQGDASRARAHSTAETGATALETANPERLALWEAAIGWPA